MLGLVGLFLAAFLAATLVPAQSEALLTVMLLTKAYPWAVLLVVASVGNVLGSCVNWWLGTKADSLSGRAWFPLKPHTLERARGWYQRYGRGLLLLSFMPVIGDPLTFAAGLLRERFWVFLLLVGGAKTARYAVLVWSVHTMMA